MLSHVISDEEIEKLITETEELSADETVKAFMDFTSENHPDMKFQMIQLIHI